MSGYHRSSVPTHFPPDYVTFDLRLPPFFRQLRDQCKVAEQMTFIFPRLVDHSPILVYHYDTYIPAFTMAEIMMKRQLNKKKGHGFSRKCASLVKQQRARIYILRRCATMLVCWYFQGDD
ncbi:hypothetical protein ACET3Z_021461 [Daucus carota]